MIEDLKRIERLVLPTDPSFRAIDIEEMDRHINDVRQNALATEKDAFLLSLMRLLALPGNGHTRLIPNHAISVLPLRFVTVGTAVRLLGVPTDFDASTGSELVSINDFPVSEIEDAASPFLAGTRQRKRVIGPILFAWPSALVRLGVCSENGPIKYQMRDQTGRLIELVPDWKNRVPGSSLYPRNEHGKSEVTWPHGTFLEIKDFGRHGLLMVLPSFFDPGETMLANAIDEASELARSRPSTPLLIDIRGNTGGNFFKALPLIDAISEGGEDRRVGVIVDKFTFSAAIVFVAILKHRLGARLRLIGEEMGDDLTFFAEGGAIDLSTDGAVARYSSAFHDWAQGRIDETTPRAIAKEIVAVGKLELDCRWIAAAQDREARDLFCREFLADLQS